MKQITKNLLLLKSLDMSASVNFSTTTEQWYVRIRVEVARDGILEGMSGQHRDTPEEAVAATLAELQEVGVAYQGVLVTDAYRKTRTHWRWNGAAFVVVEREVAA